MTMQDLRSPALVRIASDELEETIRKSLDGLPGASHTLSVYFGRDPDASRDRLATALFKQFPAPFLRATFGRDEHWELRQVTAVPASGIPDAHRDFAFRAAQSFFARPGLPRVRATPSRFDIAILYEPNDPLAPSDPKAIGRFVAAAEALGMEAEVIGREDYGRLSEFDALFIRATTAVDHYTYRFSRRAAAEGLVVIDDPTSILRCTNKVYLAELLRRHGLPTPRTVIVHRDNAASLCDTVGCPCILKRPDSSSSQGVVKADDPAALRGHLETLFATSDLLIAQEFVPTPFDWRIGILDRQPLFAAKYFMAPHHWQIIQRRRGGGFRFGTWEVMPVEDVPQEGVRLALRAANLIGSGLYGVDLKQVGDRWLVIEVNDCPNVETRVEDRILKDDLYVRVMRVFLQRLEERADGRAPRLL